MGFSSTFESAKTFLKMNFVTRITGIMIKGSLGQKVAVVLGCLGILMGIYKAFFWLLLAGAGYLICYLGFQDYEQMTKTAKENSEGK